MLTHSELTRVLNYDKETGVFTRKTSFFKTHIGAVAGWTGQDGYKRIQIGNKSYFSHRLAWFYVTGAMPIHEIDHINNDRADNRFCNLREATRNENQHNKKIQRNCSSGVKGVSWHKRTGSWVGRIMINKQTISVGYYHSIEEAEKAIKAKRDEIHTAFSNHG